MIAKFPGRLISRLATIVVLATSAVAGPPENLRLQLRWDHQFQFAGYYAALWQNYYGQAGLDVEIRSAFEPDGKFHNAIAEVVEGRADFATAGADLLQALDRGAPLVIVASVFQHSPVAFYARAETGLKSPADLTRLRVGTRKGGIAGAELRALLRAEGIDPRLVPQHAIEGNLGIDDIADGLLDVATGFTISAGWVARERGLSLTALYPATYGVDFYGSALFAHRKLIESDPELVQRFVTASMKGWTYALAHPEEIADRIARELSRTIPIRDPKEFNRFQIEPVRNLTQIPVVEPGHTNPTRWRRMHETLKEAGLVTGTFVSDELIFNPERLARERSDRITGIVVFVLIAGLSAAIAGWIWNSRRSHAHRRRTDMELRDNEQRLNSIAHHIPGDVYRRILYPDGRIKYSYLSPDLYERLGLRQEVAVADYEIFLDLIHPEDFPAWQEAVRVSAKNLTPFDIEMRFVTKSGELRWFNTKAQPRRGKDGEIIWDGVALDITDRKSAEEKADQHRAEMARVLRLGTMGEMATALAHEINQPLTAIYNYSRGCMRRIETGNSSPEELTSVLAQVSEQAERASKVIRNLGNFFRKGNPEKAWVDINELIQTVAEFTRAELESGKIKLEQHLEEDLPNVFVDRIEIEQVILNLVRNAIEAMQEVSVRRRTLNIRTGRLGEEEIEIVVGDTGPGLPDDGTRIFDPFVTTKPNGLGMGLAISRTILDAHDGRLWAEPGGDRGVAFHIALPVRQEAEVND